MTVIKSTVVHLYQRDPQEALERLNRITGLRFSRWPESLVPADVPAPEAMPDAAVDTASASSAR